jgi:GNAT superfamily N-acetyltransferase
MTIGCENDPFVIMVGERPRATEVIALYGAAGWGSADDYDEDAVQSALVNTMCVIHAADRDGRLIGFARLFGDGIFHTSLAEILVHPNWQGRGVGTAMLSKACELCAGTAIFLETFQGQEPFFRALRIRCQEPHGGHVAPPAGLRFGAGAGAKTRSMGVPDAYRSQLYFRRLRLAMGDLAGALNDFGLRSADADSAVRNLEASLARDVDSLLLPTIALELAIARRLGLLEGTTPSSVTSRSSRRVTSGSPGSARSCRGMSSSTTSSARTSPRPSLPSRKPSRGWAETSAWFAAPFWRAGSARCRESAWRETRIATGTAGECCGSGSIEGRR